MSIKAVSWALEQKLDDPIAKLVLIAIADRYNDEYGYAWPSVSWLARCADCTSRTVQNKVKVMCESGFLVREFIKGEKTNQTNRYHLPLFEGGEYHSGGETRVHPVGEAVGSGGWVKEPVHPNNTNKLYNNNTNSVLDGFEEFWSLVPRKVARKAAEKAYQRALKDTDKETIINGIKGYARTVKANETKPEYIVHPATWLNQGRYDDEPVSETASQTVENYGVTQKWYPRDEEEWLQKLGKNPDFTINFYRKQRPDLIRLAVAKGWLED